MNSFQAKSLLKQIPVLYTMNAHIKARSMLHRVNAIQRYYDARAKDIPLDNAERLAKQNLQDKFRSNSGTLHTIWVGANYSQDYSGFVQALERVGSVTPFTQETGEYGQACSKYRKETKSIRDRNSQRLLEIVDREIKRVGVDFVIGQMWTHSISIMALSQVRSKGIPVVNIVMDDKLPELWRSNDGLGSMPELAKVLDLVLTSTPEAVKRYWHHGCPAIFWPMGSDPDLFKPAECKDIDVSFVGNKYGIRGKLIDTIKKGGVGVEAFGAGWKNGPASPEKSAEIFGRSKIILGIGTVGHCNDYYTLKLRDFDATMAGALYLTHPTPELKMLFKVGEEIDFYLTPKDALHKILYYLEHPKAVERMGRAAALKAREKHTWRHRIMQMLDILGLRIPASPPGTSNGDVTNQEPITGAL